MNSRRSVFLILSGISLLHLCIAEDYNCCPGENIYSKTSKICVTPDGQPPILNCTKGKYLLDPKEESFDIFTVIEDGKLRIGEEGNTYIVQPDAYCITRMDGDGKGDPHNVAMVCFPEEEEEKERNMAMRIYFIVMIAISVIFLFLTLVIYLLISELRDLQGRCIMSTVLSQLFAYAALGGIQYKGHVMQNNNCLFSAFFLYFWMLASFFWLNIASFNVWRTVEYQRFPISDSQLFWVFFAYGWGSPLLFLIAALAVQHAPESIEEMLRPNFAESKCWFHGDLETWAYFYGPISVLLGMNIIFFLMTVFRLWRLSGCENAMPGLRSSRFKCILYLKLFMLMGILWIFEVLSFVVKESEGFWYVTDTLNSLQGLFIFLIVVCRKRVLNGLSKREWGRTIINSACPKKCLSGPDLEQEEAMLAPGDDETYVAMGSPQERQT